MTSDPYRENDDALEALLTSDPGLLDPIDVQRDVYASLVGALMASTDTALFREMLQRAAEHAGVLR